MNEEIADIVAKFKNDPLGFVLWAFPWGEAGTPLENEFPDRWQIAVMEDIRMALEHNEKLPPEERVPVQIAVASGHGIGKTAEICMILLWFISCHVTPRIVVTANTFSQLTGKTWAELHKWHKLMIHQHLFVWRAEKYFLKENPAEWKADAVPWSKEHSEAFAGTHANNVLYLFDEGSAIDDIIYEVSEGAMTTECCLWIVFGNPTRNTGRFKQCFSKFRHRWITRSIDSRTARKTNKSKIRQWLEDYGVDSDFFRIRVLGRFPKQASGQLVSEDAIEHCMKVYKAVGYEIYPIDICVDVARGGDDLTTVGVWQGRKGHELKGYPKPDNSKTSVVKTATYAAEAYRFYREKYPGVTIRVFVDDVGVGGGVTDILESWKIPTTAIIAGATANDPEKFVNMRAEMWWDACTAVASLEIELPDEPRLKDDLANMTYFMTVRGQKIQLEAVDDLKARGMPSPDYATAFVMRYAYPQLLGLPDTSRPQGKRGNSGSTTMQKRKEQGYGRTDGRSDQGRR